MPPTKPPAGLLSSDDPTDPLLDQLSLPASPPLPQQQPSELHLPGGHRVSLEPAHAELLDRFVRSAPDAAQAVADAVSGFFTPPPTPAPAPRQSDPSAQALAAGILQGLGRKYGDRDLEAAGGWLGDQAAVGWRPSKPAVATSKSPRTLRQERRAMRQQKRRQKKS